VITEELGRARRNRAAVHRPLGHGRKLHPELRNRGSEEKWLPGMVSGETIGALGLTEPGGGSDSEGVAHPRRPRR
jgi:alkylation response protein AidB-like acyl-CoA dehydrogenase